MNNLNRNLPPSVGTGIAIARPTNSRRAFVPPTRVPAASLEEQLQAVSARLLALENPPAASTGGYKNTGGHDPEQSVSDFIFYKKKAINNLYRKTHRLTFVSITKTILFRRASTDGILPLPWAEVSIASSRITSWKGFDLPRLRPTAFLDHSTN